VARRGSRWREGSHRRHGAFVCARRRGCAKDTIARHGEAQTKIRSHALTAWLVVLSLEPFMASDMPIASEKVPVQCRLV
jgi:hypothetical protein